MKRTVTALFDTRADADRAVDALHAHGFSDEIEIHDQDAPKGEGEHEAKGRFFGLFGHHRHAQTYDEGVRRGHVLVTAKVEDTRETLAAELLGAAQPVDLAEREATWRSEGWAPTTSRSAGDEGWPQTAEVATSFGPQSLVHSYIAGNTVEYSSPSSQGSPGGAAVGSETGAGRIGADTSS
jgi:hypothetical protein